MSVTRWRSRPRQLRLRHFLTAEEFALVDELSEMIIPTDEHSPGRERRRSPPTSIPVFRSWEERGRVARGPEAGRAARQQANGKPFLKASPDERNAVSTRMAQNEGKPKQPEEVFFAELKAKVVHAYYTSEIGIKQEMEYRATATCLNLLALT